MKKGAAGQRNDTWIFFNAYLFIMRERQRERMHASERGAERGAEKTLSRVRAVGAEPDMGLELTNLKIMT